MKQQCTQRMDEHTFQLSANFDGTSCLRLLLCSVLITARRDTEVCGKPRRASSHLSTVRALDGYGTSTAYTFRFHFSAAAARSIGSKYGLRRHTAAVGSVTRAATDASCSDGPIVRHIASKTRTLHATSPTVNQEASTLAVSEPLVGMPYPSESSGPSNTVDHDDIGLLSNFLSPHNLRSPNPHKLSVDVLTTLYNSLKGRDGLRALPSKRFTELLSLFGSLSLPHPRHPCIYLSKYVSLVDGEHAGSPHWALVLEIARDKEKVLRQSLNGTDRYWVMRAKLTEVVLREHETLQQDDPRLRALSQATMHYLRIWRHTPDPEIHMPYFQALLSLRSPEHISTLLKRLCKVLELHANPHPRLLDLLWQVLLRHGHQLSHSSKYDILSMITTRVSRFAPTAPVKAPSTSAVKPSQALATQHKCANALGTSALSAALGFALFPSYASPSPKFRFPAEIRRWAASQAKRAFNPDIPLGPRWGNLLLLAINRAPHRPVPERVTTHSPEDLADGDSDTDVAADAVDWRPVLVLAALEQTLRDGRTAGFESREGIRNIIHPLWRMWKVDTALEPRQRPTTVTWAILATFFRVAGQVLDGPLTDACHSFCVTRGLFCAGKAESEAERLQAVQLRVAYVLAAAACQRTSWHEVLEKSIPQDGRGEVLEALLWHFLSEDVQAAYGVYVYAKERDCRLSNSAIRALGLALVSSQSWHLAVPFLDLASSREQTEELLVAILRVFQVERREYIDPRSANALGTTLWKLYADEAPQNRFKYPVRFFFPILIASGHPARAISVVEAIHYRVPSFFTTRFYLRLMRTLVRFRQLHLTHRLLRLVPDSPAHAALDFRRKLTASLAHAGAHAAARKVHRAGTKLRGWRTARESMARAVGFKVRSPSALDTLAITSILARHPTHGPTIKYAATLLVRANRISAARKLFARTSPHLERKTSTAIGNTILHGFLKQHRLRNGRLVRHTLRTKDVLENRYSFAPDRVTINIIVKAVLRWRQAIGSDKVKALFDHMVRCGYPASERWCVPDSTSGAGPGVPFGTPLASPAFSVSALEQPISFERHVRPLYKMFVKALYMRQDVRAARMVLGILKEEEALAVKRREERNRARRMGLVRKKIKEQGREREGGHEKGGAGVP
ncbi:hypothetical protein LshimejAT787_0800280 [Lyophyllum shimeji]|uniref:Uncharacterized protein n=1 Tax=Lyophyllum shimeji TaxID=47721 RepID=A0A9P3PRQ1_LYOSH|nr:hypothetical protein LshimejAT787_0800280 [Lyophyllum shimeji]